MFTISISLVMSEAGEIGIFFVAKLFQCTDDIFMRFYYSRFSMVKHFALYVVYEHIIHRCASRKT